MTNERTFCSGKPCSLRCAYCFAKSPEYHDGVQHAELSASPSGHEEIIYPVCDSEIQFNRQIFPILSERIIAAEKPLYVSLSTKTALSNKTLQEISDLDMQMKDRGLGFFKLAVSASAFDPKTVARYEGGCSSFEKRISTLARAKDMGLQVALTVKPVLPQISISEYSRMIDNAVQVVRHVLIGGLYCSEETEFGKKTISEYPHLVSERPVDWLPNRPMWKYVEDPIQMRRVRRLIRDGGAAVFDSDHELISMMRLERLSGEFSLKKARSS